MSLTAPSPAQPPRRSSELPPAEWGQHLRRRASVLVEFELGWLAWSPTTDQQWSELADFLDGETRTIAVGRGATPRYSVREDVRSAAARAGWASLRSARGAVTISPEHPLQTMLDRVLGYGPAVDPAWLDRTELELLAQISRWFDAAGPPVPSYVAVEHQLRRELMLDPLRAIATAHFRDRVDERARLRLAPRGTPIAVLAPGGVGKSALLARHLLDRVELGELIAYLNFDHNALNPRSLAGLIAELMSQLSWQLDPESASNLEYLILQAGYLRRSGSSQSATSNRDLSYESDRWRDLLSSLHRFVGPRPLTVAFDTIEEARRRDYDLVSLRRLLVACTESGWTVVVSGRAAVPELAMEKVELAGLPPEDAVQMLADLLAAPPKSRRLHLTLAELQDRIELIGTSPLAVQLGAKLLRATHGDSGVLADLDLRAGVREGELYRRWFGYVEDPTVRLIAYPGLTLRRITPDLIRDVLAGALDLPTPDAHEADVLFEGIARESMLVERVGSATVEHRSDIRPLMLARLAHDNETSVRRIHAAAVQYYAARSDPASRVEELYHRLMQEDSARLLDERWDEGAYPELAAAVDDLPASGRAYLVGRHPELQFTFSHAELAQLDDDRQRAVLQVQVTSLIEANATEQALKLLARDRTADGVPLLPMLELQVRELVGDLTGALTLGEQERARRVRDGDVRGVLEASLHVARLRERLGGAAEAGQDLHDLAVHLDQHPTQALTDVHRLQLVVTQLRLFRFGARSDDRAELVRRAFALFDALPPQTLRGQPALLRDLAGELGTDAPARVLSAALDAGDLTDADGSISVALAGFDAAVSKVRGRDQGVLADQTKSLHVDVDASPEASWKTWIIDTDASQVASEVGSLIDNYAEEMPADVGESISRNFRIAADEANGFQIERPS